MAKRKSKKRHHVGKRRRVGAGGGVTEVVTAGAGLIAGALAGAFGIQAGNTALGTQMPAWAVPAGMTAVGGGIAVMSKKHPIGKYFGLGVAAVGAAFTINELGLSVPGISGLAMSNNAPPGTRALSMAVGRRVGCNNTMGAGPNAYMSQTVGSADKLMKVGMLVSD